MKLYIPELGDDLRLLADWTFGLYNEDRNTTLMEIVNDTREISYPFQGNKKYFDIPCTIPAGEILKVDRIYIRKGLDEYSSLTFFWKGKRTNPSVVTRTATAYPAFGLPSYSSTYQQKKPRRPVRFWAKLSDVNNIEFEKV